MIVYEADMELQGILIFSSKTVPSLTDTGGGTIFTSCVIHNYPLIYGFGNRIRESYSVITSEHFASYKSLSKDSRSKVGVTYDYVVKRLNEFLNGKGYYVFPAISLYTTTRI